MKNFQKNYNLKYKLKNKKKLQKNLGKWKQKKIQWPLLAQKCKISEVWENPCNRLRLGLDWIKFTVSQSVFYFYAILFGPCVMVTELNFSKITSFYGSEDMKRQMKNFIFVKKGKRPISPKKTAVLWKDRRSYCMWYRTERPTAPPF